jgi:hypothetical protein
MRRIRRVSVEVIRRDFSLSITREARPAADKNREAAAEDKAAQETSAPSSECPLCASPWFPLAMGNSEVPAIVQRALAKHGIHTQLSSIGELLVCGRSFELHIRAVDATNTITPKESQAQRNDLNPGKSTLHD